MSALILQVRPLIRQPLWLECTRPPVRLIKVEHEVLTPSYRLPKGLENLYAARLRLIG